MNLPARERPAESAKAAALRILTAGPRSRVQLRRATIQQLILRFGSEAEPFKEHVKVASIRELQALGERLRTASTVQEAIGPLRRSQVSDYGYDWGYPAYEFEEHWSEEFRQFSYAWALEGETMARRYLIRRQLISRFGKEMPDATLMHIENASIWCLNEIAERLLTAKSLDEAVFGPITL